MVKITSNDLKKGVHILFRGVPHVVVDHKHSYIGRGSAHVRARLKNIQTGAVLEYTFRAGESIEKADINVANMQYLYTQGNECFFMDSSTFEQTSLAKKEVGKLSQFLKVGESYQVLMMEDSAVNIRPPKKVVLKVTEAADAVKGNTATGATKTVTLETGVKVSVPLFIKNGDNLVINPETGEYIERMTNSK